MFSLFTVLFCIIVICANTLILLFWFHNLSTSGNRTIHNSQDRLHDENEEILWATTVVVARVVASPALRECTRDKDLHSLSPPSLSSPFSSLHPPPQWSPIPLPYPPSLFNPHISQFPNIIHQERISYFIYSNHTKHKASPIIWALHVISNRKENCETIFLMIFSTSSVWFEEENRVKLFRVQCRKSFGLTCSTNSRMLLHKCGLYIYTRRSISLHKCRTSKVVSGLLLTCLECCLCVFSSACV